MPNHVTAAATTPACTLMLQQQPPQAACSLPPPPTPRQVLMRVHGAVMAALRAPPTALPSGELVYQNWDVRHALARERQQVRWVTRAAQGQKHTLAAGCRPGWGCVANGPIRCACKPLCGSLVPAHPHNLSHSLPTLHLVFCRCWQACGWCSRASSLWSRSRLHTRCGAWRSRLAPPAPTTWTRPPPT